MAVISAEQAGGQSVVRYLDLIAFAEGTSTSRLTRNDGYDVIVTSLYGPEIFSSYADHPFASGRVANVIRRVPLLTSTASGRYQLLLRYWESYRESLGLTDFSPLSQDLVALQQIKERGAIRPILDGDIPHAIKLCSNIWASLPWNKDGQGGKTLDALLKRYDQAVPDLVPVPISGIAV